MKNIFTLLILSLFSLTAFGQLNFNWEEDTVELDRDFVAGLFDLASEGFDTDGDMLNDSTAYYAANHLLNESNQTEFHWMFTSLAPAEWIVQICDEDLCYPATTVDRDVTIPNSYNYEFHYQIRPNDVSGSAVINMDIWPLSDPTDIRSTYFSIIGNVVTGIFELDLVEIDVYPNPSSDFLNIVSGGNELFYSTTIHNQGGQEVLRTETTEGQLNIAELIPGTYILSLNDEHGKPIATKAFIKK